MKLVVTLSAPQAFNGLEIQGAVYELQEADMQRLEHLGHLELVHGLSEVRVMFPPQHTFAWDGPGEVPDLEMAEACFSGELWFTGEVNDCKAVSIGVPDSDLRSMFDRGPEAIVLGANSAAQVAEVLMCSGLGHLAPSLAEKVIAYAAGRELDLAPQRRAERG